MLKRIGVSVLILLLLALAGGGIWFFFFRNMKKREVLEETLVLETFDRNRFPYVRAEMFGEKTNVLRAYLEDPGEEECYDTLSILPSDRRLRLFAEGGQVGINSVSYEVRSADLEDLIENTEYTDFTRGSPNPEMILPLQNLLQKDREYRLKLTLVSEEGENLHYYTRIMLTDESLLINEMFSLALSFSKRNFNYNAARENTTYLESDETGDNSTLGLVNLKSNFNQLTYRQLGILPRGERDIRISAFDGNMGEIIIRTMAARTLESGQEEIFEIRESFVMRMGAERLYMLDYTRHMAEVFSPVRDRFTGSRILLGISESERVFALESIGGGTAFVSNRDLFYFDEGKETLIPVFSMRENNEGILEEPQKNDCKILGFGWAEDGETPIYFDFIHYGYMHRGPREGKIGISYFRYDLEQESLRELAFIPVHLDFLSLQKGMDALAFLGENGQFYFKIRDTVFALEPETGGIRAVADKLLQDTYAISRSRSIMAWQSKPDDQGAKSIYFMNFVNGRQQNIASPENMLLKPEGFVGDDLVLGALEQDRSWFMHERNRRSPYSYVEIIDHDLVSQNTYRQSEQFLDEVEIEDSRIHLNIYASGGENTYILSGEDTIVGNANFETPSSWRMGYYVSEDKGRVFYVEPTLSSSPEEIQIKDPIALEIKKDEIALPAVSEMNNKYYVYAKGQLLEIHDRPSTAVHQAYLNMGLVRFRGETVYARAATVGAKYLKNPDAVAGEYKKTAAESGISILEGLGLREIFYFITKEKYVKAYTDTGAPILIYGYDRYNIHCYNLEDGHTYKIGIEDATAMFARAFNDFYCFIH